MEHKLFNVKVCYTDPMFSMLLTHGGTSGGSHVRQEITVATTSEEAVDFVWEREVAEAEKQQATNVELLAKNKRGELNGLEKLLIRAPRTPVKREEWRATEIVLPAGYRIVRDKPGL